MADPVTAGDDPLWYKDAIVYQLHVKSFFDANDDGIGDFKGLISRLDYIAALGATAIWLLPFYPSPRRDDGYDISLYEGVSPDYGTMDEARRFITEAHARGLRVITELVINHTSDQHPWFQAARRAPKGSPERDLYVWADNDAGYPGVPIVFCDVEASNWTYDAVAGQYYWHRFYSHQPDLNFDNPEVLERVLSIMRFWLDMGVDGLRLDAVPYLVEREGTDCANLPETHAVLRKIRAHLDAHYQGRMLLAEANLWPEDTQQYFGAEADECHMAFNFPLMPRMYMAIAKEDRFPITDILRQTPEIPPTCQWAIFLRNHDELTLETVTDSERDYLWNVYAADRRARINLGIRRRLAPLMERDRRRIELMNALLLTMPGTPVIYYGDEIGMGDNIHLGDRDGVRTPMQWSPDRNGGFSKADPEKLVLPVIQDPLYGFAALNVEAQQRDPSSLLNWMRRVLAVRTQHRAFGRGTFRAFYPTNRRILAFLRVHGDERILCVANLARTLQAVELDLSEFERRVPVDLMGGTSMPPIGRAPYVLTLPPYGFYAFSLSTEAAAPDWHTGSGEQLPEFTTLVVRGGLMDALSDRHRAVIEEECLPPYLVRRSWFELQSARPATPLPRARIAWVAVVPSARRPVALTEIEAQLDGRSERFLLPLAIVWEDEAPPALVPQLALARVRNGRRVGYLTDGVALERFAHGVVKAVRESGSLALPDGSALVFSATAGLGEAEPDQSEPSEIMEIDEPTGTLAAAGDVAVRLFRRAEPARAAQAEMARLLTAAGYPHMPALLGAVLRRHLDGAVTPVLLISRRVRHQGSGASFLANQLRRALDEAAGAGEALHRRFDEEVSGLVPFLRGVGRRLGEAHALLDPAASGGAATPAGEAAAEAWALRAMQAVDRAGELIAGTAEAIAAAARRPEVAGRIAERAAAALGTPTFPVHGRFGLHRVLVAAGEAILLGFQGARSDIAAAAPAGTLPADTPWQDVAALAASLERVVATLSGEAEATPALDAATRRELLAQFRARAERAMLAGYLETAPARRADRAFLDLLLLGALLDAVEHAAAAPAAAPALARRILEVAARLADGRSEDLDAEPAEPPA
ncbi:maltose alpha-D-glucosyltransferase [Xanthobacter sp. KR7-225]|uniref:maltose alpha-D-glucosyltransferase n=1 Tax=Xanthobacter sp. KR7-225 TaxID=3156613 RepID=UPI0032B349C3